MSLPGSHEEDHKLGMISIAVQLRERGWIPTATEVAKVEYQASLEADIVPHERG